MTTAARCNRQERRTVTPSSREVAARGAQSGDGKLTARIVVIVSLSGNNFMILITPVKGHLLQKLSRFFDQRSQVWT